MKHLTYTACLICAAVISYSASEAYISHKNAQIAEKALEAVNGGHQVAMFETTPTPEAKPAVAWFMLAEAGQ